MGGGWPSRTLFARDYGAQVPGVQLLLLVEVPPSALEPPQLFDTTTGAPPVQVMVVVVAPSTSVAIVVPAGSFTVKVVLVAALDVEPVDDIV